MSTRNVSLGVRLRSVALVFLAAVLVIVGLSSLMVRSWSRVVTERTNTLAVADVVGQLQLSYSDQETGIRGYVLSGQESFLDPYWDGLAVAEMSLQELRESDTDIDGLDARIDLVEERAANWRELVANPAIERPSEGFQEDLGRAAFDDLRAALDSLDASVTVEMDQLRTRFDRVRRSAVAVLLGSAVLAIGGTIMMMSLFRRWVTQPLAEISEGAIRLQTDEHAQFPELNAPELFHITDAITSLQKSLAHERDRAVTAYRGLEQSAWLALQVRSELADELGQMPPGWSAGSSLTPAEGVVAGDCFDVGLLDSRRLYVVMIDVAGHGAAAALNALKAKSQIRAGLRSRATPGSALGMLSRETRDDAEATLLTAFVATIDLVTGVCTYASAGHPPPLLRAGDHIEELAPTGPLVGAFSASWDTKSVELTDGAMLLVYTDGATEAAGPERERFGDDRLREVMLRYDDPEDLVPGIVGAIGAFRSGIRTDDLTLLALRRDLPGIETIDAEGGTNGERSDTVPA